MSYTPGRSARRLEGVLLVDDYAGYQAARKLLPNAIIVLCWSHYLESHMIWS